MRILITSIGDSEIKSKQSSPKFQSTDDLFKSNKIKLMKPFNKPYNSISTEKLLKKTNTTLNFSSVYSIKSIDIKTPKRLTISQITKMYERPIPVQTPSSPIVDGQFTLPMILTPEEKHIKQLSLLDIVPNNAVESLFKSISMEKEKKNRHKVFTSKDFRSNDKLKDNSEYDKLNDLLQSTQVNLKHSYLIHYLSKKENCNQTVLTKVNKAKNNELSKLNKVCQMVLVNRSQDVLFKENIKKICNTNFLKTKESIRNNMDELQRNMNVSNQIVQKYPKKGINVDVCIDNLYSIQQKYWNKFDFDKLNFKRKQKNNKPVSPKHRTFSQGNIFSDQ